MDTTKYRAFSAILLWYLTLTDGAKESPFEGSIYGTIYKDGLLTASQAKHSTTVVLTAVLIKRYLL